jgi:hypothetical protein
MIPIIFHKFPLETDGHFGHFEETKLGQDGSYVEKIPEEIVNVKEEVNMQEELCSLSTNAMNTVGGMKYLPSVLLKKASSNKF